MTEEDEMIIYKELLREYDDLLKKMHTISKQSKRIKFYEYEEGCPISFDSDKYIEELKEICGDDNI